MQDGGRGGEFSCEYMMSAEFLERETMVRGFRVRLFSVDRVRWCTDKAELLRYERQREREAKKSKRFTRKNVTLENF